MPINKEQESKNEFQLASDHFDEENVTNGNDIGRSRVGENRELMSEAYGSHLFDLTNSITKTANDILNLLSQVYRKKRILDKYSKDLSDGSTVETFKSYFEKNKNVDFPDITQAIDAVRYLDEKEDILKGLNDQNVSGTDLLKKNGSELPDHEPNVTVTSNGSTADTSTTNSDKTKFEEESISRQQQLQTNHAYRNYCLSFIPGTDIPDIDLNNQAKSVRDIWNEWNYGHKGKPALKEVERQHGTKWRRGRIAKSAQRRKKVVEFIEAEYKKNQQVLQNVEVVVEELEKYRLTRGKGIFWLYGNIPERLYNDKSEPLEDNDGQKMIRHEFTGIETSQTIGNAEDNDVEMQFGDVLHNDEEVHTVDEETDSKKKVNNGSGDDEIDRAAREALVQSATAAVLAQQRDSVQGTAGDLRRLENIQRLIDQHSGVGIPEISENTDHALSKM